MIPFVQKFTFKRENDVYHRREEMKKLRTPEKDKTNSSFYQSIKHLLKKEFNVNSENKG